jgi:LPXTG-site transpeptidase (sortase) family protein
MGFSASTGGATNFHEIRDLTVTGLAPSTTGVVTSGTPSNLGSSVTFTATVTCSSTPTGDVAFYDGSTYLGLGTLSGGIATYSTSALTLGTHTITAEFLGDSNCTVSQGTVTQVVVVAPAPAVPAAAAVPATGFAPNRVTVLSPQITSFADLGDLWLEIPKLGVQMSIVGIPQSADGQWDVSWLGNDAGWLNGTAFPTWAGNSVLTGHVWNADNTAGPFAYLNTLWYGDKVIVHAWGGQYVYEVRSVLQVSPGNTDAMMKHQDQPWLTLVTCRGFDAASDTYKYRVLVRAVLVETK